MKAPGAPDPLYILARHVLLDALEALGGQRKAIVLVGAQAIYLRTGPAGLPIPEYTVDADIVLYPQFLSEEPLIGDAMEKADFKPHRTQVGRWVTKKPHEGREIDVMADLMVPETLGGPGRRGARLGAHGKLAARKVKGLEASLVDKSLMTVASLEQSDPRKIEVQVAGPAALLVAKLHKISERTDDADRSKDKDALDVLRLLRATKSDELAKTLISLCADPLAGETSRQAVKMLESLFSKPDAPGSKMAAQALVPFETAATSSASCAALTVDVLADLRDAE